MTTDQPRAHEFLWIDLETTGLIPEKGRVLEFAVVLCEDARGDDFEIVEQYTGVLHYDAAVLDGLQIDEYVRKMHDRNGLWADVAKADASIADVDDFLTQLADRLTGGKMHALTLAGSSVHFDLAWCRHWFPNFAARCSHRVFDVSTMRRAVDAWAPHPTLWPKRDSHRALQDIWDTIKEARVARKAIGWAQ